MSPTTPRDEIAPDSAERDGAQALSQYLEARDADPDSPPDSFAPSDPQAAKHFWDAVAGLGALLGDVEKRGGERTETPREADEDIPEVIGGFRILRVLGTGGMGIVYEAQQQHPRRPVALKVVRGGKLIDKQHVKLFHREEQTLARLKHPYIAAIYESGRTDDGQHFFAMELVQGQPLTTYVRREKLSMRERLELFHKICDAINYAHQRGVIHRDLKPSNILIDTDGNPKVLDFGLAKITDVDMATTTLVTEPGKIQGTLPYMSPEQARGRPDEIDLRSDVYSLGVILYELLAERLPYDVRDAALHEAIRVICEEGPRRPSTISRTLRGDVETITLKALAKEPSRRYQSVSEMAEDVHRYLTDQPILARPPSKMYEFRKLVARHKAPFAFVAALFVLVAGSGIWMSVLYTRAEQSRDLAEQRYEEIIRLADLKRLVDANDAADDLWPAHPEKIEAMETWLEAKAVPLRDNLPKHETTLASLRDQALEYDSEQQKDDRQTHPKAAELAEKKQRLGELRKELEDARAEESENAEEKTKKIEELEKTLAETEQSITELEEAVKERRTWKLSDEETQWQHDTLAGLVEGLREFVDPDPKKGTLGSVEERLDFARSIEDKSITGTEATTKWAETIADIARLEVYGGLHLKPQLGLLPLRRDPRSGLWEFQHIQTGTKPELNPDAEAVNPWVLNDDTGLVFVLIPGGTFWMGAQSENAEERHYDPLAKGNESPVHAVTLVPFFISKYEMTQGQWKRSTGANPSHYGSSWSWKGEPPAEAPIHQNQPWNPVENISWADGEDLLHRLGLVLPTEAQWEYAARVGTDSVWWTGNEKESIEGAGNLSDGWTASKGGPNWGVCEDWLEDGWAVHAPVGSLSANGFGIHDTIGNVWEWCRDLYGGYDLDVEPADGLRTGLVSARSHVFRGGGFGSSSFFARSAFRTFYAAEAHSNDIGVRPARVITE